MRHYETLLTSNILQKLAEELEDNYEKYVFDWDGLSYNETIMKGTYVFDWAVDKIN